MVGLEVVLPIVAMGEGDFRPLYRGSSDHFLTDSFLDHNKVRSMLRVAVAKHHKEEAYGLIANKKKMPLAMRKTTAGMQFQWACQQLLATMIGTMHCKLFQKL